MAKRRVGIWTIGARGGVATTVAVGLEALRQADTAPTGLVTAAAPFDQLDLAKWDELVLGGHEVRGDTLADAARQLEAQQGALPVGSADQYAEKLAEIDARIKPGVLFRSGAAIESLAETEQYQIARTPRLAIEAVAKDLVEFRETNQLDRVIVVLLGSTEPMVDLNDVPETWEELESRLDEPDETFPLRMSSLYAIAAIQQGMPIVNFTPSLGADCSAIEKLTKKIGVPHAGRDGKTGETLLKSVLAPMFAARQLKVMSWVSHNLLGNRDGAVLADPENKQAKLDSKQQLLEELLGYAPESLVSIEAIESLGDWKTAWDHVHFRGFLQVPMSLQFTWQGCDSALAAPLVIDLVRLIDHAATRGESGIVAPLGAFFKTPMGSPTHDFSEQTRALFEWVFKPTVTK